MPTLRLSLLVCCALFILFSNGQRTRYSRLSRMPMYFGKRAIDSDNTGRELDMYQGNLRSITNQLHPTLVNSIKGMNDVDKAAEFKQGLENLDKYLQNETSTSDITLDIIRNMGGEQQGNANPYFKSTQVSKLKYGMLQPMPGFWGKMLAFTSSQDGSEPVTSKILVKRRNVLGRMPSFFGKRSDLDSSKNDDVMPKRGVLNRMPAFYGKRSQDNLMKNDESERGDEVILKRGRLDRMPAFFGKRGKLDRMPAFFGKKSSPPTKTTTNNFFTYFSPDHPSMDERYSLSRMPTFYGKRAYSRLGRMPPFYGKRSQEHSSKDDLLGTGKEELLKRSSLSRMPTFYGKRSLNPPQMDDNTFVDSTDEMEKRAIVDRMPAFYGKRTLAFRNKKDSGDMDNPEEHIEPATDILQPVKEEKLNCFPNEGRGKMSDIRFRFLRLMNLLRSHGMLYRNRDTTGRNENRVADDERASNERVGESENAGLIDNQEHILDINNHGTNVISNNPFAILERNMASTKRRVLTIDRMPAFYGKRSNLDISEAQNVHSNPRQLQTQFGDQRPADLGQPSDGLLDSANKYAKEISESSDTLPVEQQSDIVKYMDALDVTNLQSDDMEMGLLKNPFMQSTKMRDDVEGETSDALLPGIFSEDSMQNPTVNGQLFGESQQTLPFSSRAGLLGDALRRNGI